MNLCLSMVITRFTRSKKAKGNVNPCLTMLVFDSPSQKGQGQCESMLNNACLWFTKPKRPRQCKSCLTMLVFDSPTQKGQGQCESILKNACLWFTRPKGQVQFESLFVIDSSHTKWTRHPPENQGRRKICTIDIYPYFPPGGIWRKVFLFVGIWGDVVMYGPRLTCYRS